MNDHIDCPGSDTCLLFPHCHFTTLSYWLRDFLAKPFMKNQDYHQRIEEPTPNGGAYSIAYYYDSEGMPCPAAKASNIEILEFDIHDQIIFRTYGVIEHLTD